RHLRKLRVLWCVWFQRERCFAANATSSMDHAVMSRCHLRAPQNEHRFVGGQRTEDRGRTTFEPSPSSALGPPSSAEPPVFVLWVAASVLNLTGCHCDLSPGRG